MNQHCKGCVHHHNAGHPKAAPAYLLQYNDWCCKVGDHAPRSERVFCKNMNLKETVPWHKKSG